MSVFGSFEDVLAVAWLDLDTDDDVDDEENLMGEEVDNSLHIKGQMMFMAEWNLIMFLAAPILTDLGTLEKSGLYVNDLPMHDFSRDLLLAADQKSDTLKEALESEQASINIQAVLILIPLEKIFYPMADCYIYATVRYFLK